MRVEHAAVKAWHHVPSSEVFRLLDVDPVTGLSATEVSRRLKEFGLNRVTARRGTPAWLRLLHQFNQPLVYILLLATCVTAFPGGVDRFFGHLRGRRHQCGHRLPAGNMGGYRGKLEHSHVAGGLTFLGAVGMIDPPRPEAMEAVRKCREAGIAVKMITGDHLVTARAIAKQIGLGPAQDDVELTALSGRELEHIADEDLPDVAERTAVFARVAPEQKLRLVCALQARATSLP
jgi:magnesium-transporting ATPase (P-type)